MIDTSISFNNIISEDNNIAEKVFIKINNERIEVKQYLPINNKLQLIGNVLAEISDNEYNFINPIHMKVYSAVEIIKAYTNIVFEENDLPQDIYDKLVQNNILNTIIKAIPSGEYEFIMNGINETVEAYYKYKTSVLGILESIGQDYSNLDFNTKEMQERMEEIGKSDNLTLLKDVMNKMG